MAPNGTASPVDVLKRLLVGRALASHKQEHQLLPKILALPVFSSDPLSSVAYATEEMMLVLVAAGAGALSLKLPIAVGIALLLAIVVTSYRQTVRAYPQGGGSYIVARENLGTVPGLVAAAAILTDYVLTVAVSVTAGTIAITSAFPSLVGDRVPIAIALVGLVTMVNLRGVRESGIVFAVPTYGFVALVMVTLAAGFVECATGCPRAATADLPLQAEAGLGLFLGLKAFSSGATALTGVEAIADGVPAFRRPQSHNAATTLAMMGVISITMFLGITALAEFLRVRVTAELAASRSVLSQIGETVFGRNALFFLLQVFTAGILVLAANTSFQDFPRLSSILARDRFMPSQFRNRGDRLVFSNGVLVLALLASALIWVFHAQLTHLIQLYVVGVFTAFTLSQAGMVRRWMRRRGPQWRRSAIINGIGASVTGVVLVIVTITKFRGGAWIVITAIPVIVAFFLAVHHHYERVGTMLRARDLAVDAERRNAVVFVVADLGPATIDAVAYLRALRPERVEPVFVGPADAYERVATVWDHRAPRFGRLHPLRQAQLHPVRALRDHVRAMARTQEEFVTVLIPELLHSHTWRQFLRRRQTLLLKAAFLFEPDIVVMNVPLLPEELLDAEAHRHHTAELERTVALVPVSAVHDATVEAVSYAISLNPWRAEALFLATDLNEVPAIIEQWGNKQMPIPLSAIEAPFRDIGAPLLEEVRKHTDRGDTVVTVVIPEFVVHRWWEHLLHNQTAFYIKRLLLFEPRVVVASVPFHLGAESRAATAAAS